MTSCTRAEHDARAQRAAATLRAGGASAPLGLRKATSNLYRDRLATPKAALDLRALSQVIRVDAAAGWVETEAQITYEALVDATLPHGVMPAVVPQLKTITAGGAVAGVGIEATSFRHGLVHDTLLEADVLLASGEIITCRPDNEHRELFFALPNSYGTLGYVLRLVMRTQPTDRCVAVEHKRFSTPEDFFAALARACDSGAADFVDGVVFAADDLALNVGRFVPDAPWLSDYTYERIYWQSLRDRGHDFLTTRDWLWRWDTDWFWCSSNFGANHALVRRLLGRQRLNSRTYTTLMRWNARCGLTRRLARWRGMAHVESVIQDVDLPADQGAAFLEFLLREIGIVPIWICPIRAPDPQRRFPLYPLAPGTQHVNFGFWDTVQRREPHARGHFNRLIEREVMDRGGIKSLYSDAYFSREEFARLYDMPRYGALKARYDPSGKLLGLYEKCVLRA